MQDKTIGGIVAVGLLGIVAFTILADSTPGGGFSGLLRSVGLAGDPEPPVATVLFTGKQTVKLKSFKDVSVVKINGVYDKPTADSGNGRPSWLCSWSNRSSRYRAKHSLEPGEEFTVNCRFGERWKGNRATGPSIVLFMVMKRRDGSEEDFDLKRLDVRTIDFYKRGKNPEWGFSSRNGEADLRSLNVSFRKIVMPQTSKHPFEFSLRARLPRRLNPGQKPGRKHYMFEFSGSVPPSSGNVYGRR